MKSSRPLFNFYAFFTPSLSVFTKFLATCRYSHHHQISPFGEHGDGYDGLDIFGCNCGLVARKLRVCNWLCEAWRSSMNTFYVVGAVVSVCLMVYLVVALLKAEDL